MKRGPSFSVATPLLYLVATPIGNLGDVSSRALEVLRAMDFIAAEDTRHTGLLLAHFEIKKPFISCHEHNEEEASDKIIALMKEGRKIAYCSDAGYPAISDPGERLVKRVLEEGYNVSAIPGPNAGLSALVGSGLPTSHFYFEGFLPAAKVARDEEIASLKNRPETLILYEAPHRIAKTLKALFAILGDRRACLARELTKTHEEYLHGTLSELAAVDPATLIGEMVLVIAGCQEQENPAPLDEADLEKALKEALQRSRPKDAAGKVALTYGLRKNEVYDFYLKHFKKD